MTEPIILRHRTALVRHELSQPVAILVRNGLLGPGRTVLDYGCGQGDDVRGLQAGGVEALGWDPHFAPDTPVVTADVVNLGFVLNVIEDVGERRETLRAAFGLARDVLAVSVMLEGQGAVEGLRPFRDGFITSRGTFQKYYRQAEFREELRQVLGREAVAAAPGVFLVFKDPAREQEYIFGRRSRAALALSRFRPPIRARPNRASPPILERAREPLDGLWRQTLSRGRLPHLDEFGSDIMAALAAAGVTPGRALGLLTRAFDADELEKASAERREDLLLHLALMRLNGIPTEQALSEGLRRDLRALFGSFRNAQAEAHAYLLGLGDASRIGAACSNVGERFGHLDDRGRLTVWARDLSQLPPLLRCYLGCASVLYGELDAVDLVRLDPEKKRVRLFVLDVDAGDTVVSSTARIDLRRQDVRIDTDLKDRTTVNAGVIRIAGGVPEAAPRAGPAFVRPPAAPSRLRQT